ncbi:MAG: insulinase family protein, partial [Oscillospiraceae bacterium]|nr:insulinase family protein [Oscillospiraceae bacterium]
DGAGLFKSYEDFLKSCTLEIIYAGFEPRTMLEPALRMASRLPERSPKSIKRPEAVAASETVDVVEEMEAEQDKLSLAYTTGKTLSFAEMNALRFGCALFGGTPTSRLFVNVRERQSLCYYINCAASQESAGGAFVECGVDGSQVERALEAVEKELARLAEEGPTDKEMEETALSFKNAYGSVRDSAGLINNYLFSSIQRYGELIAPEELTAGLTAVTKEEVMRAMSSLHLNAVSRIKAKKGAGA